MPGREEKRKIRLSGQSRFLFSFSLSLSFFSFFSPFLASFSLYLNSLVSPRGPTGSARSRLAPYQVNRTLVVVAGAGRGDEARRCAVTMLFLRRLISFFFPFRIIRRSWLLKQENEFVARQIASAAGRETRRPAPIPILIIFAYPLEGGPRAEGHRARGGEAITCHCSNSSSLSFSLSFKKNSAEENERKHADLRARQRRPAPRRGAQHEVSIPKIQARVWGRESGTLRKEQRLPSMIPTIAAQGRPSVTSVARQRRELPCLLPRSSFSPVLLMAFRAPDRAVVEQSSVLSSRRWHHALE